MNTKLKGDAMTSVSDGQSYLVVPGTPARVLRVSRNTADPSKLDISVEAEGMPIQAGNPNPAVVVTQFVVDFDQLMS